MKIMRRADGERPSAEGSTAASSIPSKTASEAGDSNERGSSSKDRLTLTREEREAKYHEVRERIFRDFPDTKSSDNPNGDQNTNMSRSSSTSGRKKAHRQKTPHDDSFEARSQFNAYYPGMNYAHGPIPYNVAMNDPSIPSQPPFMVGPGVAPPGMGYAHNGQNGMMYPGSMHMNSMPQYPMPVSPQTSSNVPWQGGNVPQQSPFSGYASMNQSPAMLNQPPSAKSSPALNNYAIPNTVPYQHAPPNWSTPPYHGNFQQPTYRSQPPVHWPNYPSQPVASPPTSYPYAQYPGQPLNMGMGMQNPHPSTFARSPFNPQTRSFVPGGVSMPRQPGKGNQPGMSPYPGLHPGVHPQWTGFPETSKIPEGHNASRAAAFSNRDSIAKWGTPSHLPRKPPPSEVSSGFDLKPRNITPSTDLHAANPSSNSKNGPLVVSGGTGMPKSN